MNLLARAIQQSISGGGFILSESFATTLYTGNGTTQDIVSDLDFVAKDGLVWIKRRNFAWSHVLVDTIRGGGMVLQSDTTSSAVNEPTAITAFNGDGFSLGSFDDTNQAAGTHVAWQFIKQKGFFDIVEYVGDGIAGRTVAIDLDDGTAVFGMAIVKSLDVSNSWYIQHRSIPATDFLRLETTAATQDAIAIWNNTQATASTLTLGSGGSNLTGQRHIAYLFAHNPSKGIFCGSYVGTGAAENKIVTGFPVGWLLVKRTDSVNGWVVHYKDAATGINMMNSLAPDSVAAEVSIVRGQFNPDGFTLSTSSATYNALGGNYIFMAIADPTQF